MNKSESEDSSVKTIAVRFDTWRDIHQLRIDLNMRSIKDVIDEIINFYKKHKKS